MKYLLALILVLFILFSYSYSMNKDVIIYTVHQKEKVIEGNWVYNNKVSALTVYLSDSGKDSLNLNYILTTKKYISGDDDNILGKMSKRELLSGKSLTMRIAYAEQLNDSLTVKLKYNYYNNTIYWKVLDNSKRLYIIREAILQKMK